MLLANLILATTAALLTASAWWFPGSLSSACLAWLACLAIVLLSYRTKNLYGLMYYYGLIINVLGFYWLFPTIADFGGFSYWAAALIFAFFAIASSVQFLVYTFVFKNLPKHLDTFGLRAALAWIFCEFVCIRIFPWYFGHTQLAFINFAQIADLAGVPLITFMMFWLSASLINFKELGYRLAFPALLFTLGLFYGASQVQKFSDFPGIIQKINVVQANLTTEQKHNMRYFLQNTQRYLTLTRAQNNAETLIIWPESVIQDFIPEDIGHIRNDPRLADFNFNAPLLVGALTFESEQVFHNSALAIFADGTIPEPYHKRILMPFGEYTPFGKFIPLLKQLNASAGDFTAGHSTRVFDYPANSADKVAYHLKLSPLICYEDIVPSLSREAVNSGAELLVNLTNDAWFGNTVAPYQHHLIASFRAIENRRFLVRSTNSGLTAVVNPIGQTEKRLDPFSEGTLMDNVRLIGYKTIYAQYLGEKPWWLICALCLLLVIKKKIKPSA